MRGIVKPRVLPALFCPLLCALALFAGRTTAVPLSRLTVRIVTGTQQLPAGSELELRIYEVGGRVRHFSLGHGEAWAHDSTHLIPLTLTEPLDPRAVMRFGIYYRAPSALAPPWELAAAEVSLSSSGGSLERLLDATLSGVIAQRGEIATEERSAGSLVCVTDADCDDHLNCNGIERCSPRDAGADARGCVKGTPVVCPVNQVCTESRGCLGPVGSAKPAPPAAR